MLSGQAVELFEQRGISVETATKCGIYSERQNGRGEVIVFPFVENGVTVNRKYRTFDKQFHQDKDAKKTFWNHEVLADPSLIDGTAALVVTEGEFDALAVIEAGYPFVVSVPDGAPAKLGQEPLDPEEDRKFDYVWRNWDALKKIKRVILAADADGPGMVLRDELARRLGSARCSFIEYPDGAKDMNDVLVEGGAAAVTKLIHSAKLYPVRGLYKISDYPEREIPKCYSTGWSELDQHLKIYLGEFMVLTGIPGHGKSTWLLALLCNMAMQYGLKVAMASFEMSPVPYIRDDLRKYLSPQNRDLLSGDFDPDQFIEQHFTFIDYDPRTDDDDITLDWILERAEDAVIRHGAKILVIDPWNEVEQARRNQESETEYVSRAIKEMKRFARSYNVAVIVVAHPYKMGGSHTGVKRPNLYDIAGSAHWFNKADHGVVIWRKDIGSSCVEVDVKKSRFREAGKPGIVPLEYNTITGQYCYRPEETL